MKITAVYAGTFDPVTLGHESIIRRAAGMFDQLIVAVGVNSKKRPLFSAQDRVHMLREVTDCMDNVLVETFDGLLIKYCEEQSAKVIVRGLRTISDFEQELTLAYTNSDLSPKTETVWLPTSPMNGFISSSMVKEIASLGGDVARYVSPSVAAALLDGYTNPTFEMSQAPEKLSSALESVERWDGKERISRRLSEHFPRFEGIHGSVPGMLVKVDADGTRTIGRFINREFVKNDQNE